jgi:hypothetical protein
MARIQITFLFVLSAFLSVGATSQASAQSFACPVTEPNGTIAPGQTRTTMGGQWYGNGNMWTLLWPEGTLEVIYPGGPGEVLDDGSLSMKSPWWLAVPSVFAGQRHDVSRQRIFVRSVDYLVALCPLHCPSSRQACRSHTR